MAKKEKILEYINDISIIFDNKKATPEEVRAAHKRQELREQKLADSPILKNNINKKVAKKIPVIPPKPDLVNGHSDFDPEEWIDTIDPSWWLPEDDKKVEADSLYEKYLELLKAGELLPGTTFQMFEKNFMDYDTETISKIKKEINKRIAAKKINEGLAALVGEKV
tara:strand:- start:31 stop:528 length:498 start_codon:yes stop_codon:yes gene_type:complete